MRAESSAEAIAVLLAFGVAVLTVALLRLVGGSIAGARLAGVGLPAGFLAGWAWFVGVNFPPEGTYGLTSHIALGGLVLGVLLDALGARRWLRLPGTLGFVGMCVWSALGQPEHLPPTPVARIELVLAAVLLVAVWLTLLARLKAHRQPERGADGVVVILTLGLGLGLIALQVEATPVIGPALGLAAAAFGALLVVWPLRLPLPLSAAYGGGGAVLGLAQALAASWPSTLVPMLVLGLVLFVGPTARRLPGSWRVTPLWVGLLAVLPLGLGVLLAYAARSH